MPGAAWGTHDKPSFPPAKPIGAAGVHSGRSAGCCLIVAVLNSKGGVGKSTLAVHLAVWLHAQGLRVIGVDADRQASFTRWLNTAQPAIETAALDSAFQILNKLPEISSRCDAIVADGPAALGAEIGALAASADVALLPIGASMLDVWATYRTARLIYKIRFQGKRRGLPAAFTVLNRVIAGEPAVQVAVRAVANFGFPTAQTLIHNAAAFVAACERGCTVWQLGDAGARAASELEQLFRETLNLSVGTDTVEDRLTRPITTAALAALRELPAGRPVASSRPSRG